MKEDKLEVGMYVRYRYYNEQKIGKIDFIKQDELIKENFIYLTNDARVYVSEILNASYNLIDLIEVGDYVNDLVVTRICFDEETGEKYLNMYGSMSDWNNEDIKSIVTKEQFNSMKYEVGE